MSQRRSHSSQSGIALIVVLIVLTIMMAATISMVRNAGVGMGIVGNLGFKQNATSVGDLGVEAARTWLSAQAAATLDNPQPAAAYFAAGIPNAGPPAVPDFDPLTYNWMAAGNSVIAPDAVNLGNTVRYVIHRMCPANGPPPPNTPPSAISCVFPATSASASHSSGGGGAGLSSLVSPFYRVTVRVDGPRNTLSYTQVMIY